MLTKCAEINYTFQMIMSSCEKYLLVVQMLCTNYNFCKKHTKVVYIRLLKQVATCTISPYVDDIYTIVEVILNLKYMPMKVNMKPKHKTLYIFGH